MIDLSVKRMVWIALILFLIDQIAKLIVLRFLPESEQVILLDGFFRLVHWRNTGAAWSLFSGNNRLLALIAIGAMVTLFFARHHFDAHTLPGQIALGLMFGGILGNLVDRMRLGHVVDFIYFYIPRRGGGEIGFPAFNVADTAICAGVGLILILVWRNQPRIVDSEPKSTPNA